MHEMKRDNKGKMPYHLIPMDAIDEVVKVLQFGAGKYGDRNWEKGGGWMGNVASLFRHASKWIQGEDKDEESGLLHTAHMVCNCLFLLAFQLRSIGLDDRPKTDQKPFCCIAMAADGVGHHSLGCDNFSTQDSECPEGKWRP